MKLIDVFPDALTGSGIFDALDNYNVPWKTDISSISLDLEYFGNVSGDKTVSPLIRKLSVNGVLSDAAISKIAQSLYNMHGLRWTKLWNTYQLEYDPIQNYNMTEIMSDDDTVTTYGRTHSKTGTEVDDRTRTDDNTESIYGFNSISASDSDESDRTINDDNTHTYNVSDADTGTDRQSHSYELTRSGNIGVTTSQQMIESERALWMWRYFYDVVFPDVDKMLTISIYSDDVIVESGGVAPTGTINITSNGDYDVTEYASAAVSVPNTYTEADNGMVVYNGELVSQIGREISENGTYDTTLNNAVSVSVPNTYSAADEGKVVDNGVLVAQGSQTITQNGTYDTTLISELIANIPSGSNILSGISIPTVNVGDNGDVYLRYGLPDEYDALDYIQGTGTQHLRIPYKPNVKTAVALKLNLQNIDTSAIFGANWEAQGYFLMTYSNAFRWHEDASHIVNSNAISLNTDYVVRASMDGLVVDNTDYPSVSIADPNGYDLSIFTTTISPQGAKGSYKLYWFDLYNDDSLYYHLVPAKRKSDDAVGMYDVYGGKFYTNLGTGVFQYGSIINNDNVYDIYCKVNGVWQNLVGTDINDVNTSI